MKVSVILPFWNAGQYVEEALRSIDYQDIPVHEVVVIDQGADSPERQFPVHTQSQYPWLKVHSVDRTNPAEARNIGLRLITGDAVAFLDDDDVWPRGKLGRQLPRLVDHDVVGGLVSTFRDGDKADGGLPGRVQYNVGAYIFRREHLERIGDFDGALAPAEDIDLMFRAAESQFLILRSVELYYRLRAGSLTTTDPMEYVRIFDTAMLIALKRSNARGEPLLSLDRFIDQSPQA